MKIVLTTGGAGFIGSNFIKYFLKRNRNFIIINVDKQDFPAEMGRLSDLENSPRYHHIKGDVCNQDLIEYVFRKFKPSWIINFCSEPEHLRNPGKSAISNTSSYTATISLLEGAKAIWSRIPQADKRFVQVSTDEVYGLPDRGAEPIDESAALMPLDPLAALRAGADLMVSAYNKAYNIPTVILRCCSIYGPWQGPVCTVPSMIRSVLERKEPQFRRDSPAKEWLYVNDLNSVITRALFFASPGSVFNIGSGECITDEELSGILVRLAGKQSITAPVPAQSGKVREVSRLDFRKAENKLRWSKGASLEEGLTNTLKWYENYLKL